MYFWEELRSFAVLAAMLTAMIAALCGIAAGAHVLISPRACDAATQGSPLPHRWTFWADCQVQDARGVWVSLDQYLAVAPQIGPAE